MKNCEEMVESLFARREQYRHKQKQRKKVMVAVASAAVCCLCAVTVWGVSQGPEGVTEQPPVQIEDPVVTQPPETRPAYQITLNPIEIAPNQMMGIALHRDDFVAMSVEEMKAYYAMDYIPDVPDDLEARNGSPGIFKRYGGTGEIYWDTTELRYSNEAKARDVSVRVAKGHLPYVFSYPFQFTPEMSKINGVEIPIGVTDSGAYYTEFVHNGVGFMIFAEGLTETEYVDILASVLD